MSRIESLWMSLLVTASVIAHAGVSRANERHFSFTYESPTLPRGHAEIEPWVTTRFGRQQYFMGLDYRIEFEGGITDRLLGSVYLNGGSFAAGDGMGRTSGSEFSGISTEFKYRILDPVADPIGLALYTELTIGPEFIELEEKIIIDRRVGDFLAALNVVYAHEWNYRGGGRENEDELEFDLGLGYFVAPNLMIGLEGRNKNNFSDTHEPHYEYSVLYAGPTISYSTHSFYVVGSVLPQIVALRGATAGDSRNLEDHEMVNARIIVGMHF